MSTTRWIIETGCADHDIVERHGSPVGSDRRGSIDCPGGSRIVVDPANLPPEAIQRAAVALSIAVCGVDESDDVGCMDDHRSDAEAAVTAFLSHPEPGDQACKHCDGEGEASYVGGPGSGWVT